MIILFLQGATLAVLLLVIIFTKLGCIYLRKLQTMNSFIILLTQEVLIIRDLLLIRIPIAIICRQEDFLL